MTSALLSAQPDSAAELFSAAGLRAGAVAVVRTTVGCHIEEGDRAVVDHCSLVPEVLAVLRPGEGDLRDEVEVEYDPTAFRVVNGGNLGFRGGALQFVAPLVIDRGVVRVASPLSISFVGTDDDQIVRALAHRGGVSRLAQVLGHTNHTDLFADRSRRLFTRRRSSLVIPGIGTISPQQMSREAGISRRSRRQVSPRVWRQVEENPQLLALVVN